jgi:hypothetical protein
VEAEAGRNPENAIKTVRTNGNCNWLDILKYYREEGSRGREKVIFGVFKI